MMKKDNFTRFFIYIVPIGLVFATVVGILIHVMNKEDEGQDVSKRPARTLSLQEVESLERKINEFLPVRSLETKETRANLKNMANMISGTLSPENAGYAIKFSKGVAHHGELFRALWVTLKGEDEEKVVRVMTSYDGREKEAGKIAVALAVAQSMSASVPDVSVRFIFLSGLEENPMGLSRVSAETYGPVIWLGEGAPERTRNVTLSANNPMETALKLREMIDTAVMEQ